MHTKLLQRILHKNAQAPSVDGFNSPGIERNESATPGSVTSHYVKETQKPESTSTPIARGLLRSSTDNAPSPGPNGVSSGVSESKTAKALLRKVLRNMDSR